MKPQFLGYKHLVRLEKVVKKRELGHVMLTINIML